MLVLLYIFRDILFQMAMSESSNIRSQHATDLIIALRPIMLKVLKKCSDSDVIDTHTAQCVLSIYSAQIRVSCSAYFYPESISKFTQLLNLLVFIF